jgi:hypothetical protein
MLRQDLPIRPAACQGNPLRNIILAATYREICHGQHISRFCDLYKGWVGRLKPTLRQIHVAGEKLFVDFAGRTAEVIDGLSGEIVTVQIFVATLGASSFTPAFAGAGSTPRRYGAKPFRIGSPRTFAPSPILMARHARRSATI